MNFSSIMISLITSIIGLYYFHHGKQKSDFLFMLVGITLMLYTYFLSSITVELLLGIILVATPFVLKRFI